MPGNVTRLYLHVFDWPADGQLVVDGLLNQPRRAFVLGDTGGRELSVERRRDGLRVRLPASAPDAVDPVIVLDVDGRPSVSPTRPGRPPGPSAEARPTESEGGPLRVETVAGAAA